MKLYSTGTVIWTRTVDLSSVTRSNLVVVMVTVLDALHVPILHVTTSEAGPAIGADNSPE